MARRQREDDEEDERSLSQQSRQLVSAPGKPLFPW
jgi:hypothetical protein